MSKVLVFMAGLTLTVVGLQTPGITATLTTYSNRADFLEETNALKASPFPNLGYGLQQISHEDLTIKPVVNIRPWSEPTLVLQPRSVFPDGAILVTGQEDLDIDIARPIDAFGFDFYEPSRQSYIDSVFQVTLLNMGQSIGSFEFSNPNDIVSFVGVSADKYFNRVEIREIHGNIDDEIFGGSFYLSKESPAPVPEPATAIGTYTILMGLGAFLKSKPKGK